MILLFSKKPRKSWIRHQRDDFEPDQACPYEWEGIEFFFCFKYIPAFKDQHCLRTVCTKI